MMASAAAAPWDQMTSRALAHLRQGIAVWSTAGHLNSCNPAFAEAFGLPPDALQGLGPAALLERARMHGTLIGWEAPAGTECKALDGFVLVCSDGRMLSATDSALPDGGSASLLVDVTEARRNQQALTQARDKAAAADQSKSRFLRAANHDLRQPLASLKILVYSCLVADKEEDRRQALHAMEVSVAIMEDLLGSLLNIGQLDAGKIEPAIATFQISSILTRLGVQYTHRAREKGFELRIIPSKLAVVSDRVLLERILSNLVGNAIR